MKLDLTEIIDRLKEIQKEFNASTDPTERYALIQALNHIAENELPFHGWIEKYKAMFSWMDREI